MVEVAAIVLAAGCSTRFAADAGQGTSKVLARLDGRPLVVHAAEVAAASRAGPVIVVTGRDAEHVAAALASLDVTPVHNPRFGEGMAGSIAASLSAVPVTAEAVLILLADMPRLLPTTLDALISAFDCERPDALVPMYGGQRGNPVLISRALFPALLQLNGDEGARRILADGNHRVLFCQVDDPGVLVDVDTREALDALTGGSSCS